MITNMLTEVRRRKINRLRISMKIENIRKSHIEVTEVKTTITELENSKEGFNNRLAKAEERISTHEDRAV